MLKHILPNKKYPLSYKWYLHVRRLLYSEAGKLEDKFTKKERIKIEKFWKNKVIQTYDDNINKVGLLFTFRKLSCIYIYIYMFCEKKTYLNN